MPANTNKNTKTNPEAIKRAKRAGIIAALVALPLVFIFWVIATFLVFLAAGGKMGIGWGGETEHGNLLIEGMLDVAVTILALIILYRAGKQYYDRSLQKPISSR
jgi:hypothetical protein